MYFVYILRCADNTLYTGLTTDMPRRLNEHNHSSKLGARYTRSRRPVSVLAVSKPLRDRSSAGKLEYALKKKTRRHKLKWASTESAAYRLRLLRPVL